MKKIAISTVVILTLFSNNILADNYKQTPKDVKAMAIQKAKDESHLQEKKIIKEAVDSLELTTNALKSLNKNNPKKAKEYLEKALGKLEIILQNPNSPKLIPVDVFTHTIDFVGSVSDVNNALNRIKSNLNKRNIIVAREIIDILKSEIDINTINLPLATYPDALRLAEKYINDKEYEKAKAILAVALNTFVEDEIIVPLPFLKATMLLNVASNLASNGDKKRALEFLNSAKNELKLSEALGYISHSVYDYEVLQSDIKAIEREIKGKNNTQEMFNNLNNKIEDFRTKIYQPKG